METPAPPAAPVVTQNPDIRYLGRLLGDVIRAYGGDRLYRQTEYIRSASVDRARGLHGADVVDTGLEALSLDDTLSFVRGFMLFSMLANLAEDRQGVAAYPDADVASAIARLEAHGIDRDAVADLLAHALIVPVLTAHPTEVRRKSMIDHKNRIADLMTLKDGGRSETMWVIRFCAPSLLYGGFQETEGLGESAFGDRTSAPNFEHDAGSAVRVAEKPDDKVGAIDSDEHCRGQPSVQ